MNKSGKKTELIIIGLLTLIIIGALVWACTFSTTGISPGERQEVIETRIWLVAWIVLSLILAPLVGKLFGWSFEIFQKVEQNSESKNEKNEESDA